jgi:translation initiation factor 2 beta subunit (eIF-2beta)/eIF-5
LKRIRKNLQENNPELASKQKIVIKPPDIERLAKKSVIKNFGEICNQLNRDLNHVMNFFLSELCAEGSLAGAEEDTKLAELSKWLSMKQ